jgi:hypothetical protein
MLSMSCVAVVAMEFFVPFIGPSGQFLGSASIEFGEMTLLLLCVALWFVVE